MRPDADNLPFAFACGLSLACSLGQLSASIYWSSAKAQSLHLQNHTQSQPRGGVFVSETRGMLQMPLGQLGQLLARCPQQLIIGFLDGVCNVINGIHIPLISSRILSATPPASTCSWSSHEFLFQCPPWLEKLGTHILPLQKISQAKKISLDCEMWCLAGELLYVRSKSSSSSVQYEYPPSSLFFFFALMCWNSSVGNLDFHNSSLIHG